MSELAPLASFVQSVAHRFDDSGRRVLSRKIATITKDSIKRQISAQRSPDGTAFAPRKQGIRSQKGKIRRGKMFTKSHRQLKVITTADKAEVGFGGRYGSIMQVHQYGMTMRPSPHARPTTYAMRETVGFSDEAIRQIERAVREFMVM